MSNFANGFPGMPPAPGTAMVDRLNMAVHVRRYLKLLSRRWPIILIAVVICGSISTYKAYTTPNTYQAVATLGLAMKVQNAGPNNATVVEQVQNYYERQLRVMMSGRVTDRVLTNLQKDRSPLSPFPSHNASADIGRGSTFDFNVTSTDLGFAVKFVSNWAEEFMKYKKEELSNLLGKSSETTQQEIYNYSKKLEEARERLVNYQREHNIGSVKETRIGEQQRLDKLLEDYQTIATQRQRLEKTAKEDLAKGVISDGDKPKGAQNRSNQIQETADPLTKFAGGSRYRDLSIKIHAAEDEVGQWSGVLKEKHDYMISLVKVRDDLKRQLSYELDLIEKERVAQIDSLKTQEGIMEPEIKRSREKVLDLDKVQNELDRLKEDEQSVSTTLQGLRKQLQSYDLVNSDEGAFSILEPGHASMGGAPISPRRTKMVLNGLLIGLAIGVGIVYLLHRLDDRLEIAEDIEDALEEPVLGQIPLVDTKTSVDGRVLITRLHQHDMFAESVRGVRSAVLLGATKEHPRRVLLISSAVPGDGKTTFTVNFAATLAMASHRVLLIDADLRRGNVHAYFAQQREEGLSEVLAGDVHWTDVRKESELPNLHFISTGAIPSSPGELLISPIMTQLLGEVRKEYDYVIIDCPPLTALDDTFTLLPISDGIMFVVRAGQTSIRFARTALQTARQRGATIIGLVLNGITADNPYYYYNYYYHSYYNKGQAATVAEGGTVAVKTPGSKMPDPKRSPGRPMSIDVVAQARAIGHRPASSQVNEAERSKAQDYKARRAVVRQPILPKPETPVAPAGEIIATTPPLAQGDQTPPPVA